MLMQFDKKAGGGLYCVPSYFLFESMEESH